jgi:hypothetical protein
MEWEVLMHDVKLELLNTFLIKGADVFRMCAKGYVEELKGHVSKSLTIHALQSCRLAPPNSFADQWNAKSLGSTILC